MASASLVFVLRSPVNNISLSGDINSSVCPLSYMCGTSSGGNCVSNAATSPSDDVESVNHFKELAGYIVGGFVSGQPMNLTFEIQICQEHDFHRTEFH